MTINNDNLIDSYVNRLRKNKIVIYLLHGVIKKNNYKVRNYTRKHLEFKFFQDLLFKLKNSGQCVSMDEILYYHVNKEPPPKNAFAITFDDGFENNLSIAGPLIDELKMKCMIYLTTDFIQNNKMSWIDKIEYAVEIKNDFIVNAKWLVKPIKIKSVSDKVNFLNLVRNYAKNNHNLNLNLFSENLCNKLGVTNFLMDNQLDKKINWNQIKSLKNSQVFSFGGHSHTHPILSYLKTKDLKFELDKSLQMLKDYGEIETVHYSYPEGLQNCYNEKVISELKKRGIKICPTAIDGINDIKTCPFSLKRIAVI